MLKDFDNLALKLTLILKGSNEHSALKHYNASLSLGIIELHIMKIQRKCKLFFRFHLNLYFILYHLGLEWSPLKINWRYIRSGAFLKIALFFMLFFWYFFQNVYSWVHWSEIRVHFLYWMHEIKQLFWPECKESINKFHS